jgi:hypothetical protein
MAALVGMFVLRCSGVGVRRCMSSALDGLEEIGRFAVFDDW